MKEGVEEVKKFVDILDKNADIQALVKTAKTPAEIIQIAESSGIKTNIESLRFWSRELTAQYFPWA